MELPDDVGADLAGGGQDPKEIPTRRWSERVSEASRILPKHRGASVSAAWPPGELPDQLLARVPAELRELVEEQHLVVRECSRMSPDAGLGQLDRALYLAPEVKVVHLNHQRHHAGLAALGLSHTLREVGGLPYPDFDLVRPLADPAASLDWHEELTKAGLMRCYLAAGAEPEKADVSLAAPECDRCGMSCSDNVVLLDREPILSREINDLHPLEP